MERSSGLQVVGRKDAFGWSGVVLELLLVVVVDEDGACLESVSG